MNISPCINNVYCKLLLNSTLLVRLYYLFCKNDCDAIVVIYGCQPERYLNENAGLLLRVDVSGVYCMIEKYLEQCVLIVNTILIVSMSTNKPYCIVLLLLKMIIRTKVQIGLSVCGLNDSIFFKYLLAPLCVGGYVKLTLNNCCIREQRPVFAEMICTNELMCGYDMACVTDCCRRHFYGETFIFGDYVSMSFFFFEKYN